ncbi:DUF1801 domain-containing protein [Emticicia sp. BO119]|uniref:DUF1801 domain-containing protein n=1 Tax=Emticicia sp. BO119 TaxID=2757768 RepID=UPI0015F051C6|nr:DUF1801 domain-containing protein [Emticicia sp. BO119]MBA4852482.1 DUF1801 domain-containing protein [Emticicia sp. BO119]
MPSDLENYYLKQNEPIQSCLLALRVIIMDLYPLITHQRKYQIPFFYYKEKKLAYLWVTKKKVQIGFIEDKCLQKPIEGVRLKDQYQSIIINPNEDIPIEVIVENLKTLMHLYDGLD